MHVALAGNPNSGKTTLFNGLTGLQQKVANYAGVTVERREGRTRFGDRDACVVDLPGAYSLLAHGEDERIALNALLDEDFDVVVAVVDAMLLERGLSYVFGLQELGLTIVVALNMFDELEASGASIDIEHLEDELCCPVVGLSAASGAGVDLLKQRVAEAVSASASRRFELDEGYEAAIGDVAERGGLGDGEAIWLIGSLGVAGEEQGMSSDRSAGLHALGPTWIQPEAADAALAKLREYPELPASIIAARQDSADLLADRVFKRGPTRVSFTDRVDAWLLHPVLGVVVFATVMFLVFQSIFAWSDPGIAAIESLVGGLQGGIRAALGSGALVDLLADGVIGGVGNVIVFVPQIAFLFALIAILEDSGYLARAALLSDRILARAGLHGRAFVPLLSGFACAVPAIMATRSIRNSRDRLVTILVTPLMSCSARLPVYALMISALFASEASVWGIFSVGGAMLFALYALSVVLAIVAAFVLKRFVLRGPTPQLVLELPPYRRPQLRSILRRVAERCSLFIKQAGTVILAITIVLWALLYFPQPNREMSETDAVEQSIAGTIGRTIEPVIAPLGYNWQIGVGLLASFAAREVFVSTMALVHGHEGEAEADDPTLRETIRTAKDPRTGEPLYTPLVGLSLMVFFLVAMQCMSTLAVIRRETRSWRWPLLALVSMNALAWILAFVVYQGGRALGWT